MNRLTLFLLLAAAPAAFAQGGWISLFNGKDFTGWKIGGDQIHIHDQGRRHGRQGSGRACFLRWTGQATTTLRTSN